MSNRELDQWIHDNIMCVKRKYTRKHPFTAPYYSTMRSHADKVLAKIGEDPVMKRRFLMAWSEPGDKATDVWLYLTATPRQLMEAAKIAAESAKR
jgi:hypothetical protein